MRQVLVFGSGNHRHAASIVNPTINTPDLAPIFAKYFVNYGVFSNMVIPHKIHKIHLC